jgi:hypothetical protein
MKTNRYNMVAFKAVATVGLQLDVEFQERFSAGEQRWRIK